ERWPQDTSNDQAFVGLANAARARGQFERAIHLLAATNRDALIEYFERFSELRDAYEDDVSSVRAQLGEDAFAKAWAVGKALTREQAIAYALADDTELNSTEATSEPQPASDALSVRELEVLRLVAKGLSNREIAQRLVLAVSTVKWYLNV